MKFTAANTGGNSLLFDTGTSVGLGTTTPAFPVQALGTDASRVVDVQNPVGAGLVATNTAAAGLNGGAGAVGITIQTGLLAAGAWAEQGHTNGTAVIGAGNNTPRSTLAGGSGGAFSGTFRGLYARSSTTGTGAALDAEQFGDVVRTAFFNGTTFFKINGVGTVSTNVADATDPAGQRRITLYATETPEVIFQDFGEARLVKGRAHVALDPRFAGAVRIDAKHPLRVKIQLEDDERVLGVVVKNKTAQGFDVVELRGGASNAKFQWRVVANRADEKLADGQISQYANLRFGVHQPAEAAVVGASRLQTIASHASQPDVERTVDATAAAADPAAATVAPAASVDDAAAAEVSSGCTTTTPSAAGLLVIFGLVFVRRRPRPRSR